MATPFRMYFWFQPTCPACLMAEPELTRFGKAHPEGIIVKINAKNHHSPVAGFKAKETPTYFLVIGKESGIDHVGGLMAEDLEEFLADAQRDPDQEEEEEEDGEEEFDDEDSFEDFPPQKGEEE